MRYDIDAEGYITDVYFNCNSGTCVEYTGTIPDSYSSLEEWAEKACIRAYKIVEGNLVFDENKYNELQEIWEIEEEENTLSTHKWTNDRLKKSNSVVTDELSKTQSGNSLLVLNDSGNYEIPSLLVTSPTVSNVNVISSKIGRAHV